jgi:alkylation response protein AidB-like acyl-CoA dehydrogenase
MNTGIAAEQEGLVAAAEALAPTIAACRGMPRAWGGPEADPLTTIRVIEALSRADGSVGWCVMIGCDGGYFSAFLDQDVAREMYRDLDAVRGGYRVSGR